MVAHPVTLFDLDGTLIDPKVGITGSVQYALSQMGIDEPQPEVLTRFIGPPLQESFARYYSLNEAATAQAIAHYRHYFREKGVFQNILYDGIPTLLEALQNQGRTVMVATSKPTVFAEQIIDKWGLTRYFNQIVGSFLDGTRASKTEILQFCVEQFPDVRRASFVMIGDREHDVMGARNTGMDSVAVTYGYGSLQELQLAVPTHVVHSVAELSDWLLQDSMRAPRD